MNTTADHNDGSCDTLLVGDCTLREALWISTPTASTIEFNIPTSDSNYDSDAGVWTILLTSPMSGFSDDVVDGTTQATNILSDTNPYGPEIVISGENLVPGESCWTIGSNNTIKGLVINGCQASGLVVTGDGNTIAGNYIGTDATGGSAAGIQREGIGLGIGAENNVIGGTDPGARNIISGNGEAGIHLSSADTARNVIQGNYIGTDASGASPLANGEEGVLIESDAHDNTVGPNNVIAYNSSGVKIRSGAHDNTTGPGNTIAHNGRAGVWVDGAGSRYNRITQKSIYANGGLGIELTNSGNEQMPLPTIYTAGCGSASGWVSLADWEIELFTGPDEEGKTYLASAFSDVSGNWSASGLDVTGKYLSATSTALNTTNTSAFSATAVDCTWMFLPLVVRSH